MRVPTNFLLYQRHRSDISPLGAHPGRHWEVSSVWPTPVAPLRYGGTYSGLCPTALKYNGGSGNLSPNPHGPPDARQPLGSYYLPLPRSLNHPFYSYLCPNSKRYQENRRFFNIQPTRANNGHHRPESASTGLSSHLYPCFL